MDTRSYFPEEEPPAGSPWAEHRDQDSVQIARVHIGQKRSNPATLLLYLRQQGVEVERLIFGRVHDGQYSAHQIQQTWGYDGADHS